jgi:hypothetical protein
MQTYANHNDVGSQKHWMNMMLILFPQFLHLGRVGKKKKLNLRIGRPSFINLIYRCEYLTNEGIIMVFFLAFLQEIASCSDVNPKSQLASLGQ